VSIRSYFQRQGKDSERLSACKLFWQEAEYLPAQQSGVIELFTVVAVYLNGYFLFRESRVKAPAANGMKAVF
jgi:hypothetical protein